MFWKQKKMKGDNSVTEVEQLVIMPEKKAESLNREEEENKLPSSEESLLVIAQHVILIQEQLERLVSGMQYQEEESVTVKKTKK